MFCHLAAYNFFGPQPFPSTPSRIKNLPDTSFRYGLDGLNDDQGQKELLPAVKAALEVYPSAKVELAKGGLILKPSPAPIVRQSVGVSRGLADKVKASLPPPEPELPLSLHHLHPRTIETFRKLYPRLDPYACDMDFRHFLNTNATEQPHNYDSAFMGFAKKWAKNNC